MRKISHYRLISLVRQLLPRDPLELKNSTEFNHEWMEKVVKEMEKELTKGGLDTRFQLNLSDETLSGILGEDAVALVSNCGDFDEWKPSHDASRPAMYALAHFLTGGDTRKITLVSQCHCGREEKFSHANSSLIGMLEIHGDKVQVLLKQ